MGESERNKRPNLNLICTYLEMKNIVAILQKMVQGSSSDRVSARGIFLKAKYCFD